MHMALLPDKEGLLINSNICERSGGWCQQNRTVSEQMLGAQLKSANDCRESQCLLAAELQKGQADSRGAWPRDGVQTLDTQVMPRQ